MSMLHLRRSTRARRYTFLQTYPRSGHNGESEDLVAVLSDFYNPELLTPNQRTGTETLGNTTGFTKIGTNTTISSSTEQPHTGTRSLKTITNGDAAEEGCRVTTTGLTTATPYTFGCWVYAPNGALMQLQMYDNLTATNFNFIGTGTWQYIEGTKTINSTTCSSYILTRKGTTPQAITFYIDDLSLSKTRTIIPISGKTVEFTVNGTTVGTATTNASGVATFEYTITQNNGTYPITATFAGDEVYAYSNGNSTLTVIE